MSTELMDLINKKKQQLAAERAAGIRFAKPAPGKHKYRILPSWRKGEAQFWHDFGQHFVKSTDGKVQAVYLCADKTHDRECHVCAAIGRGIKSTDDDVTVKWLKEANSSKQFLMNALHITGPEPKKVIVLSVGVKAFDQIVSIVEEYGDITALDKGFDLIIERTGTGLETAYTVVPAAKSNPVDPSVMGNLHDIDAICNQFSEAGEARALTAVAKLLGVTTPVTPQPARLAQDLGNLDDAEVVDVENVADDSELDDLLGDLEDSAA